MDKPNANGASVGTSGALADGKKPFGGHTGRKPLELPPGIVPGTPAHEQWKRDKEAERKRAARAVARQLDRPPVIPASTAPLSDSQPNSADAASLSLAVEDALPDVGWVAADFDACAPEVIGLLESWIIESNTELAASGGLPKKVVDKIAADSAFPRNSKASLSRTSPDMLAKFANTVSLPVTLKPYVAGIPSIAVILIGQLKTRATIYRLIEEDKKLRAPVPPPADPTAGPSQPGQTTPPTEPAPMMGNRT